MPKYRNGTERPIIFGGVTFQPGEAKSVNVFLPYTELGLTKISDEPAVPSPIMLSEKVELDPGVPQTLNIPWGADRVSVSAFVEEEGEASLKLGDGAEGIPLNASSGGYISPPNGHKWSKTAKVILESEDGAIVHILVEGVA